LTSDCGRVSSNIARCAMTRFAPLGSAAWTAAAGARISPVSEASCEAEAEAEAELLPGAKDCGSWGGDDEWSCREAVGGVPERAREPSSVYPVGRVGMYVDPNILPGAEFVMGGNKWIGRYR
jgi:hypothetical protein